MKRFSQFAIPTFLVIPLLGLAQINDAANEAGGADSSKPLETIWVAGMRTDSAIGGATATVLAEQPEDPECELIWIDGVEQWEGHSSEGAQS